MMKAVGYDSTVIITMVEAVGQNPIVHYNGGFSRIQTHSSLQ